jgi:hypothetical protein
MRAGTALALCSAIAVLACSEPPGETRGIDTRVYVDRTEAQVGDPIGITIEIDAPPGFVVETPNALPSSDAFANESIELLEPLQTERGARHRVLWTLRARDLGEHRLPTLDVPIVHPDGRVETLPAGGQPLAVRSVRGELPERDVFFDIREPVPAERRRAPLIVGTALASVAALLTVLVVRHRRGAGRDETPDPRVLSRHALAEIDAILAEPAEERALAGQLGSPLWSFVAAYWDVPATTATPDELPERVDAALADALHVIECARFAPPATASETAGPVAAAVERACEFLRDLRGDVDDA